MKKIQSTTPFTLKGHASLAHFPLDCSIFYRFGYARWETTKLFEVLKGIDHGQESYNDPIL